MEFDFLPKLPKSDLDDRAFEDLVNECLLRIPRYCPEWTNYNPSDPGITLIELFAWLTDQMLLRFNQVPRRNYVAFLELLGVRLQPPSPAQTEITFYLSAALDEPYAIPAGTEVATIRTDTDDAIIFSTDRPLIIGQPRIRHLLGAEVVEPRPQSLRDRLVGTWTMEREGEWQGPELSVFEDRPQPGNCFYLVFDGNDPIEGNAIAITVRAEAATSTGIDPNQPPRRWEAWNGSEWESVLLHEIDDKTQGFSFSELVRQGGDPLSGADVMLHLPRPWPATQFLGYQGRWLRCVYTPPQPPQPGYGRSPRILGVRSRAIGGTIAASQCRQIRNEILGESDGTPGQTFQIQNAPVLPRKENEYILVTPPGGLPQIWQETTDFASSTPEDPHYTIDSVTGTVQFGPLIREPAALREETESRSRLHSRLDRPHISPALERHYGAVPPRGSQIQLVAYRTGGGQKGNVQPGTIRVLKSAVPYVSSAINHKPGRNGTDAESLENAAMRVPRMLRTRDRAVTVEDFETLTLKAGNGSVARVRCLSATQTERPGTVRLVVVPQADTEAIARGEGIHPDWLALNPDLVNRILGYLDERRLLGVEVLCRAPDYVGVAVQTEVALDPEYAHSRAAGTLLRQMQVALYHFLNPITGGPEGTGWPFGRPVYPSDIVTQLQAFPGVRYLGAVQLFELRRQGHAWTRSLPKDPVIDPGALGLICSWRDDALRSSHVISPI
jgi:predicted phage baseplate assembly protein